MPKYNIISYDVLGNTKDGYHVNQSFYTGQQVDIPEDASDYLINRRLGVRGVEWEGDSEYTLYGTFKRNGKPALELQKVED